MLFTKFKPRSRERDKENDEARKARLLLCLDQLIAEASNERRGLLQRYEDSVVDASFALEAAQESRGSRVDAKLGELEAAVVYCEDRRDALERVVLALSDLKAKAEATL